MLITWLSLGGSGTNQVYRRSKTLSTIVKGQFDLIGFDPRGINQTLVSLLAVRGVSSSIDGNV
jgi:hypothetical protein